MKRPKCIFTIEEKDLVFDLWKQGLGFSDIDLALEAQLGSIFTILREAGGIKPRPSTRNTKHLTIEEREEIRVGLSTKLSIRAIARSLNRSPSTISRELARNRGRRYYKAVDADNRAKNIIHHSLIAYLRRKRPMRHSRYHSRSGDRASSTL